MPTILMINMRNFCFAVAILLLLVSSGGALAGTFNAILQEDGNVSLSGSESFECVPEVGSSAYVILYSTPLGGSGQIIGWIESSSPTVSFTDMTDNLSCANPGNYVYRVHFSGGKWVTDYLGNKVCGSMGAPAVDATVNLPLGRETIIHAPADRVTGMEKISVPFNFAYVSDSCYDAGTNIDPCKTRSVTVYVNSTAVYWNNGTNGLPLNGVAEASYDFSRITGPTIIKASASCGGTARTTEKVI